ncbi:MAG: hypothetical protein M1816_001677 [Peltula sp. TS41687]|nr:MAG: hypothetical protein M1816_001677 [Peltula sp. TS41687]
MARSQAKSNPKQIRQQAQGETYSTLRKPEGKGGEPKHLLPSPPISNALNTNAPQHLPPPLNPDAVSPLGLPHEFEANLKPDRKRKRSQEAEASQDHSEKRPRVKTNDNRSSRRVETWLRKGSYPEDFFESGNKTWEDIKADTMATRLEANEANDLARPLLARKKSTAYLRQQGLEGSMITHTEKSEDKSVPYRNAGYETLLRLKGSHLVDSPEGITDDSELDCQTLLTTTQMVPQDSLFRDDLFRATCDKLRTRNESRVVEDISRLLVPSAETLATYGAAELIHLVVNVNERWAESIPVTDTRPQPDFCVGFSLSAFTDSQLRNLTPYIGDLPPVNYFSFFLATWRMYFPFLTCEAKSGIGGLDVADKQNAHSMTMAVRGIVELFKLVNRQDELDRKVLAFSISHDDAYVRIYGHYALLKDRVATFYRHPIRCFELRAQNGRDKWTAYQFTMNVYFQFMPKLHKLICSAIDQLSPGQASQGSNLLPQIPLGDSFAGTDRESELLDSQEMATNAPTSQDPVGSKKRRLTGNAVLQQQILQRDEQLEKQKQEYEKQNQEYEKQKQEYEQRMNLQLNQVIKQMQSSSNASSGNDSEALRMLRQELERQRQENERQKQENERQKQENERQKQESKEQLERHRQESKEQLDQLMNMMRQQVSTTG